MVYTCHPRILSSLYKFISIYYSSPPLLYGHHLMQWGSGLIRRMAFLEENNLVLYCLSASEIWPLVGGGIYEENYSIDILPVKFKKTRHLKI